MTSPKSSSSSETSSSISSAEWRATVYLVPNGAIADPNAPTVAELNAIVARAQPAKWAGVAE
jgi:hypothetical protein